MIICNEFEGSAVSHALKLNKCFLRTVDLNVAKYFLHRVNIEFLKIPFKKGFCLHINFGEKPIPLKKYKKNILWILNKPKSVYDYSKYDLVLCSNYSDSQELGFSFFEPGAFINKEDYVSSNKNIKFSFVGEPDNFIKNISKYIDVVRYNYQDVDLIFNILSVSNFFVFPKNSGYMPLMAYNAPLLNCIAVLKEGSKGILDKYIRVPGIKYSKVNWDMEPYEFNLRDQLIKISEIIHGL
tara:strand:- start:8560 stop:9276 length:717 start_codon:yes stop_codon:yes gene_type:complete